MKHKYKIYKTFINCELLGDCNQSYTLLNNDDYVVR